MPYALKSVKIGGKTCYYVINKATGKKFSKEPLSKTMAEKQLKALHIHTRE